MQWELVISKRFNDCNVQPRSQHDDITRYVDPSLAPLSDRSGLFLRTRWNKFRKACTRLFTNYSKATGDRGSFADWLEKKGGIDPDTPSGQRLVIASHLVRLGQSRTRWESVKRCTRSIDPKMMECYEDGQGAHDARPVVCLSDEDTDRRTPKKSASSRKTKRQKRVSSDLSASLPQLNRFLNDAASNERITNSYLKGVLASQSETNCRPSEGPSTKSFIDVTELMFTYKKAVAAQE